MPLYDRRRPHSLDVAIRDDDDDDKKKNDTDKDTKKDDDADKNGNPDSPKTSNSPSSTSSTIAKPTDSPSPTASSGPPAQAPLSSSSALISATSIPPASSGKAPSPAAVVTPSPASSSQIPSGAPSSPSASSVPSQVRQSSKNAAQSTLVSSQNATTSTSASTSSPSPTTLASITSTARAQVTGPAKTEVTATTWVTDVVPVFTSPAMETQKPERTEHHDGTILSRGGEAALITLVVLGAISLLAGGLFYLRIHRRKKQERSMRHDENAFDPSNTGSLSQPEMSFPEAMYSSHLSRSSESSSALYAGDLNQRPETVSTKPAYSRGRFSPFRSNPVNPDPFPLPLPTPNPFADPPRNKAWDVLRGRPRSTTLTDRGSWIKNPFKNPESDRFDPFGELQEKARKERRRYVEEIRREEEERRRKEEERVWLERERMGGAGLQVPKQSARKGSDVTIAGLGVLDRSDDMTGFDNR